MQKLLQSTESLNFTYSTAGTSVALGYARGLGISLDITNQAPSAGTFTAAVTDICTKAGHGFLTGLKVQVSTTTTLPGGLSAATDYFVIKIDADTFKLASSLVNAQAGTAIDITTTGTGTHTITPTALAGANYKMQGSFDDSSWYDIGSSTNITASATALVEKVDPQFEYVRMYFTITAGQLSISMNTSLRG